jgi:hypothetical protein
MLTIGPMTTAMVAFCSLAGVASGCSTGNKATEDTSSAAEATVPVLDASTLDAPGPDPRRCVAIPAACPAQQPSYATDIAPILAAKCNTCHSGKSDGGPWPLTEYEYIVDWQSLVVADIEYCTMPPTGAPPLTSAEQDAILTWLVCNAPNN